MSDQVVKNPERVAILQKIEELEKKGIFDQDAENDPEGRELLPNEVDYLCKKLSSKIERKMAYSQSHKFAKKMMKAGQLVIKDIRGIEYLKNMATGAMITCNHFHPFDSFAIEIGFEAAGFKKRKMHRIIDEKNYTSMQGFFGFLMRNYYTLPLSRNKRTMVNMMKAVDTLLAKRHFVLVYPEQSLWWNYRKPKPLKDGAYKLAVRNNTPVVPVFITMEDTDVLDGDGYPVQAYTIHICKPIYPKENLSKQENIAYMRDENYRVWKEVYENTYGIPLTYTTVQ